MSRSMPTYLLGPGLVVVFATFVAFACGGSDTPEDPPPVCYASHPVPDGGMVRNLRAEEWADLVVRGYREGGESSQNCVGDPVAWRATDDACDVHEPEDEEAPEAVALSEESVIVGRSDTVARKPVWVITHHFADGDGFGPVALTERSEQGVAVRALGTLRMPLSRARLRLRESGGQEFIVADAERCPTEADDEGGDDEDAPPANVADGEEAEGEEEPTCIRYARILPVVGDQLMSPEVRNADGERCLGPNQVWLSREQTVALENGWERTFRLAASMEFSAGAIIVHEQVTAEDSDPRDPGRPPRLFRTTDADRIVVMQRGGMRSSGLPLFERVVRAHGSTHLPIAEAPEDREESGSSGGSR